MIESRSYIKGRFNKVNLSLANSKAAEASTEEQLWM
jgi:hypothetical protein